LISIAVFREVPEVVPADGHDVSRREVVPLRCLTARSIEPIATWSRFRQVSSQFLPRGDFLCGFPQFLDAVTEEVEFPVDFFGKGRSKVKQVAVDLSGRVTGGSADAIGEGIADLLLLVG